MSNPATHREELEATRDELIETLDQRHRETLQTVHAAFDRLLALVPVEIERPAKQWQPRSPLYRLALDAMCAFFSEEERFPSAVELLDTMPVYDNDMMPVSVHFDAEKGVIRWRTWDGRRKTTSLRTFVNGMPRLRAAVHGSYMHSFSKNLN